MKSPDQGMPDGEDSVSPAPGEFDWTSFRTVPIEEFVAAAAVLKVLGTMGDAYLSKLGELLADSTPAILRRIRLSRYPRENKGRLVINTGRSTIVFVFDGDLSDDAKIALIDIDITDENLNGVTLRWDVSSGEWRRA